MITLTESAAIQLNEMRNAEPEAPGYLRLSIEAGGCSGQEYGMGFDELKNGDVEIESCGIKMVVDPKSLELLKGCEVDFDDGLHGKGFDLRNPNAKSTCGCGKSFN